MLNSEAEMEQRLAESERSVDQLQRRLAGQEAQLKLQLAEQKVPHLRKRVFLKGTRACGQYQKWVLKISQLFSNS